jgi:hypothetical protein
MPDGGRMCIGRRRTRASTTLRRSRRACRRGRRPRSLPAAARCR